MNARRRSLDAVPAPRRKHLDRKALQLLADRTGPRGINIVALEGQCRKEIGSLLRSARILEQRTAVVLWRWWTRCCWATRYRAVTGRVAVTGDSGESHSRWQGCSAQEEQRLSLDLGRCSIRAFDTVTFLRVSDIDWALRRRQCDPQPCEPEASSLLAVGRRMFDELGAGG